MGILETEIDDPVFYAREMQREHTVVALEGHAEVKHVTLLQPSWHASMAHNVPYHPRRSRSSRYAVCAVAYATTRTCSFYHVA
jgi:hypothetical protein